MRSLDGGSLEPVSRVKSIKAGVWYGTRGAGWATPACPICLWHKRGTTGAEKPGTPVADASSSSTLWLTLIWRVRERESGVCRGARGIIITHASCDWTGLFHFPPHLILHGVVFFCDENKWYLTIAGFLWHVPLPVTLLSWNTFIYPYW
jgi:hypothetical protein